MTEEEIRATIRQNIEPPQSKPTLSSLRRTEWCRAFIELMRNRLIIGALRYGTWEMKFRTNHGYDCIGSAIYRLQQYQKTGNMELLVDAANLCMIEFDGPTHRSPHWESVDDGHHVSKKYR